MKSKIFNISTIIWLVSLLLYFAGGLVWCYISSWKFCVLVVFPVSACYGVGITAIKTSKETKNDYLISFFGAILSVILNIPLLIIIKTKDYGSIYPTFAFISLIICILQVVMVLIFALMTPGTFFSKEHSLQNTLSNNLKSISKETTYAFGYILMFACSVFSAFWAIAGFLDYSRGYPYNQSTSDGVIRNLYILCIAVMAILGGISCIVSYVLVTTRKKINKSTVIFTIAAIALFSTSFASTSHPIFRPLSLIVIIIVGSTLFDKKEARLSLKTPLRFLAIFICVALLSVFVVYEYLFASEYSRVYSQNGINIPFVYYLLHDTSIFSERGYYNAYGFTFADHYPFIVLPIALLIIAFIKKNVNKNFFTRFLTILVVTSLTTIISILFVSISATNGFSDLYYYYSSPFYTRIPSYMRELNSFIALVPYALTAVLALITLILLKRQKQEIPQTEGTSPEPVQANEPMPLFYMLRTIGLSVTLLIFVLFIPVVFDGFNHFTSVLDLTFGSDYIYIPDIFASHFINSFVLIMVSLPFIYPALAFNTYKKDSKSTIFLEYILCGFMIVCFAIYIVLVIVSNTQSRFNFMTLAYLPIILIIMWLVASIIWPKRQALVLYFEKLKADKAEALEKRKQRQEEERLKKEALQKEKEELAKKKAQEKAELEAKHQKEEEARRQKEEEARRQEEEKRHQEKEARLKAEQEQKQKEAISSSPKNAPTSNGAESKIHQLQELVALKDCGAITEEEFNALKEEILKGGK